MTEQQIEEIIQNKLGTELPKLKRKWFIFGGLAALVVPLTIWAASITKPHTFSDGDTLSASKLNENFDTLYTKVNALDTKTEKGLGTYCGKTAATYDGAQVSGYTGAKSRCETACGNVNAHMCTGHEIAISQQLGITLPANRLWYSAYVFVNIGVSFQEGSDCVAWTSNNAAIRGAIIDNTSNFQTSINNCATLQAIACCL